MNKVFKKFLVGFISLGMIIITGSGASFINSNNSNEVSTKVTKDDRDIGSKLETYDTGIFHQDAHWPSVVEEAGYALSLDTDGSTYLIKNENDLFFLSYMTSKSDNHDQYDTKNYKISLPTGVTTIDCTNYNWFPICCSSFTSGFAGNFDANGATIKIKIVDTSTDISNFGLFGTFGDHHVGAAFTPSISSLTIYSDITINDSYNSDVRIGGVSGYFSHGNLIDSNVFTTISVGNDSDGFDNSNYLLKLGGLCGQSNSFYASNCNVDVSIDVLTSSSTTKNIKEICAGGFSAHNYAGSAENVYVNISHFAFGSAGESQITSKDVRIGLFVGVNYTWNPSKDNFVNCFVTYKGINCYFKNQTSSSAFNFGMFSSYLMFNKEVCDYRMIDIRPSDADQNITLEGKGMDFNVSLFSPTIRSDVYMTKNDICLSFCSVIVNKMTIYASTSPNFSFAGFTSNYTSTNNTTYPSLNLFKCIFRIDDSLVIDKNTDADATFSKYIITKKDAAKLNSKFSLAEACGFFYNGEDVTTYSSDETKALSHSLLFSNLLVTDYTEAYTSSNKDEKNSLLDAATSTIFSDDIEDFKADDLFFMAESDNNFLAFYNITDFYYEGNPDVSTDMMTESFSPTEETPLQTILIGGHFLKTYKLPGSDTYEPASDDPMYLYLIDLIYVNGYEITYDLAGGTINGEYQSFLGNADFTLPTDVTKDGYTFDGWYIPDGDGTKLTKLVSGDYEDDISLYAKWTEDVEPEPDEPTGPTLPIGTEFKIIYDTKDGTINDTNYPTTYICGVGVTLPTNVTKVNYDFSGWSYRNLNGVIITSISSRQYGDVYLNANYIVSANAKKYSIEYVNEAGKINGDYKTSYLDEEVVLPTDVTSDYGTFVGWYDNPEFTGRRVYKISDTDTGNKTYYARYTFNRYAIHYEFDDATGIVEYYYYGDEVTLLNNFAKSGYTFVGLSETKDDDTNLVTKINKGDYGDKTYYVIFKKNETTNYNWIIWVVLGVLVVAAGISVPLIISKHKKVAK